MASSENTGQQGANAGMEQRLARVLGRCLPGSHLAGLARLTGGANQQMWLLDVEQADGARSRLVLRQASQWNTADENQLALDNEARLLLLAAEHDLPVPAVVAILQPEDNLGSGYLMAHVPGETIPQKILRDDRYRMACDLLPRQCGETLARIHQLPVTGLGFLRTLTVEQLVDELYAEYQGYREPRPIFELAFRWLRDHLPASASGHGLVHGDFRNGNLMINEQGLASVLDWELAYIGDPMADLGWLCVPSWRFGRIDHPVGGFGGLEALLDGYEAVSGERPDPAVVHFWEIFGTLKWGVICQKMAASFVSGQDTSPERGAIGRRASETEVDLLRALVPLPAVASA